MAWKRCNFKWYRHSLQFITPLTLGRYRTAPIAHSVPRCSLTSHSTLRSREANRKQPPFDMSAPVVQLAPLNNVNPILNVLSVLRTIYVFFIRENMLTWWALQGKRNPRADMEGMPPICTMCDLLIHLQ